MRIHESNPDVIRSDTAGRVREEAPGVGSERKTAPIGPTPRADRVEISEEARSLAEQARQDATIIDAEGPPEPGMSAEQLESLRARLAEGFYDRPEILDQVADRLLESGDLTSGPSE